MESLSRLDANLQSLRPGEDWGGSERMDGEEGLGLGDGTGVFQDLADLDDLAEQLPQSYGGARMDDLDLDKLARQLGDEAAVDARTLQQLEQALRDSGTLQRGSDGNLRLTPKAMRQLGKALLRDVAEKMSGRQGQRDLRQAGAAGERSGATREWAFGDTEPWDVTRTITNAWSYRRRRWRPAWGVRLSIGDVEVTETEARTQACVALLVDTSFSMAMDGRWVPMKRTALALHTLIRSRFRGDALQLIGFGRHAEVMEIEQLTALDAMWDKGTNLHHALLLANRHFRKHPSAQPVLLIVTDGEPTSHLEPDGEVYFSYPPQPADGRLRRPRARQRLPPRRPDHVLPARRGPRPGPVHRLDGRPGRGPGRRPRARRPRRRRRRLLPRLPRSARTIRPRRLRRLVRRPGFWVGLTESHSALEWPLCHRQGSRVGRTRTDSTDGTRVNDA